MFVDVLDLGRKILGLMLLAPLLAACGQAEAENATPQAEAAAPEAEDVDRLLAMLAKDMSTGKAATEAARQTGLPRKDLYQRLLDLKDADGQ